MVDSAEIAAGGLEFDGQVLDVEQWHAGCFFLRLSYIHGIVITSVFVSQEALMSGPIVPIS